MKWKETINKFFRKKQTRKLEEIDYQEAKEIVKKEKRSYVNRCKK